MKQYSGKRNKFVFKEFIAINGAIWNFKNLLANSMNVLQRVTNRRNIRIEIDLTSSDLGR